MDMETDPGDVMEDCLGNTLILRKILQHFSTTELLQLSLVNKKWNYEARVFLRDREVLCNIMSSDPTFEDLKDFASSLRRMKEVEKVVPFSGMSITIGDVDKDGRSLCKGSAKEINTVCEDIINQTIWKHLLVIFIPGWKEHRKSVQILMLEKILKKLSSALEEFSLSIESGPMDRRIQHFLQQFSFPRLKAFKFEDKHTEDELYTELIKAVVSRAPNLQVLHTVGTTNLSANLLQGSSAMHVTDYPYSPSEDEVPECVAVAGQFQLKRMRLVAFSRNFNLERFNRITSTVLQASRTSLSSMCIDASFLVPVRSYGICLENLTTIEMSLNPRKLKHFQPRIWKLVKSFDFPRLFPNLNTLAINDESHLDCRLDKFSKMIGQGNALLQRPMSGRAKSIKNICLQWLPFSSFLFQYVAEMFPNIQKLSIKTNEIPAFTHIWDSKLDLQELQIILELSSKLQRSLDSAFCGIFPEEVATLRLMDDEYLKAVNIVPVMPSILCLKGLKTFKFVYGFGMRPDLKYLIARVTDLVAFQRCPGLKATLY